MLHTPLGSFNRLILNPVSLTQSFVSESEPFFDPKDDTEEILIEDFANPSLKNVKLYEKFYHTQLNHFGKSDWNPSTEDKLVLIPF